MKTSKLFLLMGCGLFVSLAFMLAVFSPSEDYQPTLETPVTTVEDWSGWTLDIPEIDLRYKMTQVYEQGNTIPVPKTTPGYYLNKEGNIFIVGHNTTVFQRLDEMPQHINIVIDGNWQTYTLVEHAMLPVQDIDMDSIISYQGVVVMTCAGYRVGETMSHRLILYYR